MEPRCPQLSYAPMAKEGDEEKTLKTKICQEKKYIKEMGGSSDAYKPNNTKYVAVQNFVLNPHNLISGGKEHSQEGLSWS